MRVWWLVLLAGCDGVFGLPHIYSTTDARDSAVEADARPGCAVDRFNDGIDGMLTRWDRYSDMPGYEMGVDNEQLVATLAPAERGYAWVHSIVRVDMTNAIVSTEVSVGGTNTQTYFSILVDPRNLYFFSVAGGSLSMRMWVDGQDQVLLLVPFDPLAHRFWRFEHNPLDISVEFWTSPNGRDWTHRHSIAPTVPLTSMFVELGAGVFAPGTTAPSEGRYDNVEYCVKP